jgi:hypothetical protein
MTSNVFRPMTPVLKETRAPALSSLRRPELSKLPILTTIATFYLIFSRLPPASFQAFSYSSGLLYPYFNSPTLVAFGNKGNLSISDIGANSLFEFENPLQLGGVPLKLKRGDIYVDAATHMPIRYKGGQEYRRATFRVCGEPHSSVVSIVVTAAALVVMLLLAWLNFSRRTNSPAEPLSRYI